MMDELKKRRIIEAAKVYFRTVIKPKHLDGVKKLKLKDFTTNPFLVNLCGGADSVLLAKSLVYYRIWETCINSNIGQNLQNFIAHIDEIVDGTSGIKGIDIEFVDAIDGRRKFCLCKADPQNIGEDDVIAIMSHFKYLMDKSKPDSTKLQFDNLIVGILYGNSTELSDNCKVINSTFDVYCGTDFWYHLTGDSNFYHRLSKAFGEVVEEDNIDGSKLIQDKVKEIAEEVRL